MTDSTTTTPPRQSSPSGRFVLRIEPDLHVALRRAAKDAGLSLNEYCARKLAAPGNHRAGPFEEAIRQASTMFGEQLVGAVVYGSWARDELTEGSDLDLLVVLSSDLPITRALYRAWDTAPLHWSSHSVEPHFVHLPGDDARVTGSWAEVATEGIVLFDPEFEISRLLVRIRRRILAMGLVRRRSQGQPYWVEAL